MNELRPIPSRYLREIVDAAVRGGDTLAEIEREIVDVAALSPDGRSALWLYAWGAVERRRSGRPTAVVETEPGLTYR